MAQKRPFNEGKRHFKKQKKQKKAGEGSNEDVLVKDVQRMLQDAKLSSEDRDQSPPALENFTEIEVDIAELSSTGDGLGMKDGKVVVVPFTAPGDKVKAKLYVSEAGKDFALADFVEVLESSKHRTETPKCPYFSQCSGCQFQHLPYSYQLTHKQSIVEKAYRNFSGLPASVIPAVAETIGSPLQYGYRTKLTPHFDEPAGARGARRNGTMPNWQGVPPIGYCKKGTRKTMDIEDCPIGTDAVRKGFKNERGRVAKEIENYKRGATLLLRENTQRLSKEESESRGEPQENEVLEDRGEHVHLKTYITDAKAVSTEYVDDFRFDNPAGSFFQNNNSVLPVVTKYIRDTILGPSDPSKPPIKNLIDAYCGSGFFTVTLSSLFTNSIGIDISGQSIASASTNAELNNLPKDSTHFIAADANALFDSVSQEKFPPNETVVVIDPPRKGCDEAFLKQLMAFGPARVCYVSCNVHTQARDVGMLVRDGEDSEGLPMKGMYELESLRGIDFFPMTAHVEGLAMLRRKG